MSIQQLFFSGGLSTPPSPVTFTAPGSFTVPAAVSSVTVKIFAAGGSNEDGYYSPTLGGSGACIIGNYAVQSGDIIYINDAGVQTSYASSVTWKRGATVMGWAVAGAGGAAGTPGGDGGDGWGDRFGGTGGNGGVLNTAADGGGSGFSASGGGGALMTQGGSGGSGSCGTSSNGNIGGGPATSAGAAPATVQGNGCPGDNASGGNGGYGGGGYYAGGSGGGGEGRMNYPDSGEGGGGGGGGTSYQSGAMTSVTSTLCEDSTDSDRGTAGNRGATGKVVLVY